LPEPGAEFHKEYIWRFLKWKSRKFCPLGFSSFYSACIQKAGIKMSGAIMSSGERVALS
jgi:hypothetical protein